MNSRFVQAFIMGVLLSSCGNADTEVLRVDSPDRSLTAIVVHGETGATVSTPTKVQLAKAGEKSGDVILVADNVEDLKIRWLSSNQLEVGYRKARIFQFTNFWQRSLGPLVDIQLKPGSN